MRLRLALGCLLLANCAVIHHAVVVPEDPVLGLPLTIAGDVRICVQETTQRWSCLTMGELRQVIATLKRL